jgi:uncharacterized protein (DUF1697 family)
MAELRALFEEFGCSEVSSYIQSGNVLFRASPALAKKVPGLVQGALADRYGYHLPLVLRTARELATLAKKNPFLGLGIDTKSLHLMCLATTPSPAQVAALEPERFQPDAFSLCGKDVFLHFPNGTARSKLTNAYFDKTLGTTSTVRNWNTLAKLVELSSP